MMYKPFAFNGFLLDEYIRVVSRMWYTMQYINEHLNVMWLALCWLNIVPQQIAFNKHSSIQPTDCWIWAACDTSASHPYNNTFYWVLIYFFEIHRWCMYIIFLKVCISMIVQAFKKRCPKYSYNLTYSIFKVDVPVIVSGWQKYWWAKILSLQVRLPSYKHDS